MEKIKIGLVDDKIKLLSSLKANLEFLPDLEVCWAANNGEEAISWINKKMVDVVLMDIEMPVIDGIQATSKIKFLYPEVKVIMLTVFDNEDKIFEAILSGASGYLIKDEKIPRIHQYILEAMEGGAPMSPLIASKALRLITSMHYKNSAEKKEKAESELSEREMEILQKLAMGQSYNAIAEVLFISPKTVRNHIHNIYGKLQINTRFEAILLAQKNNWV